MSQESKLEDVLKQRILNVVKDFCQTSGIIFGVSYEEKQILDQIRLLNKSGLSLKEIYKYLLDRHDKRNYERE